MIRNILIGVLLIMMYFGFSQEDENGAIFKEKTYVFPYNLTLPDKIQNLPPKLNEISGLSKIDNERFACIQDEKGNIYVLNFITAEIEKKINFADHGDFEGITLVGSTAWALKSSGDLFRVKDFMDGEEVLRAKKYETDLTKKNDSEGLTYDKANNRLLIACKGHPFIGDKKGKHKKAIYEFDIEEKKFNKKPVFLIDLDQIKSFRDYNTMTQLGISLLSSIDENKGDVTFQPSDLAVHPKTNNIYVIGAVGDLLLVLNPKGVILAMIDLDDKLFKQAEGICFNENGTLYISNEGGESKATILKFDMKIIQEK